MSIKYWKQRLAAGVLAGLLTGTAVAEAAAVTEEFEPDMSQIETILEEQTSAWDELEQTSEHVTETEPESSSIFEEWTELQTLTEEFESEPQTEPEESGTEAGTEPGTESDTETEAEEFQTEEIMTDESSISEEISSSETDSQTAAAIPVYKDVIECSAFGYTSASTAAYLKADRQTAAAFMIPEGTRMSVRAVILENDEICWYRAIFAMDETGYEAYVRPETVVVDDGGISMYDLTADIDQTDQFPADYQVLIKALKQKYPNWVFQPLYTGLDFNYAVEQEQSLVNRNLVHISQIMDWKSLKSVGEDANGDVYNYNWQTDTWYEWEPAIVAASDESVAYCMDPRNFINEQYIFMFEDLSYHGEFQTVETVNALLKGTFMYNTNVPGEDFTYAWLLHWVGQKYGINPVMLASRLRQEQGIAGTSELISGVYEGYENLYNHFNIMASGKTREEIVTSGLKIAKKGSSMILPYALEDKADAQTEEETADEEDSSAEDMPMKQDESAQAEEAYTGPWDTPTKSIIGGALNIATTFILVGQDSLYLQKFDVDNTDGKLFWHQYMQNVQAPMSEGRMVKTSYTNMSLLDQPFVFSIPVFENMPQATKAPTSDLNPNNCLNRLTVNGKRAFIEFDKDVSDFTIEVGYSTESAVIDIIPASSKAMVDAIKEVTLEVGDNINHFTVTAETGETRSYTLNIIRLQEGVQEPETEPEDADLGYGELLIDGTTVYIGLENGKKGSVYIPYYNMNASEDGQFVMIDGVDTGTNADTFLKNIDVKGNIWAGLYYGTDLTQRAGEDPVGTGVYLIISDHGTGEVVMCSPIIIYGDITGDGIFNIVDFSMGKAQLLGRYEMEEEQKFASDLNGDGIFNIADFSLMKAVLLGRYELVQKGTE